MNLFRVFLILSVLSAVAGGALFFLGSFAYVAVLMVGAVFALGAAGAKLLSRPQEGQGPTRPAGRGAAS